MITDREIADKRNEVLMLRLQINEHKERRRLDEIEQSELDDVLPSRNELVDRLESVFALNRQQEDTICTYMDAVASQNKVLKDFQDEINEKDTTIKEMKSKVEPPNLAVMVLLHNLHAKTEALEAELRDEMQQKHVAIRLGAEKAATVLRLNETISDLRMAASDMLDTINECARGEAEDSKVLMQVVEAVKIWEEYQYTQSISQIANIVEDYLDAPEGPVVTLETPSIGTRVVSKNEEAHTIDEAKMRAVQSLVECGDNWVVCTDEDAIEVMQQKETIDGLKDFIRAHGSDVDDRDRHIEKLAHELADEKMTLAAYRSNPLSDQVADRDNRIEQSMVLNEALRIDMELAHNLSRDHIAGQDRFIKELTKDLDARNTVIKDFKAIEQRETDRLHQTIEGNGKIIDELNDMCSDVCDKLERIEKISKKARTFGDVINRVSANHIAIDEITKIVQEE